MRLLLFSDIHCNRGACNRIVEASQNADVVVGAGDFCNMHHGLDETIALLCPITKPTIVVPGNAETFAELHEACQRWPSATVLHGSQTTIDGVVFYGIGGGIPITPFGNWSYDFSEDEAAELLLNCPDGGVLVSHSPPKGLLDRSSAGKSLGSESVKATVDKCQPKLVVCGHIHASAGRSEQFKATAVVNAGPEGILWEL